MSEFSRVIGVRLPLAVVAGTLAAVALGGEAQANPGNTNEPLYMGGYTCAGQRFNTDADCDNVLNRFDVYPGINDNRIDLDGNGRADWKDKAFSPADITTIPNIPARPATPNANTAPLAPVPQVNPNVANSATTAELNKMLMDIHDRRMQVPGLLTPASPAYSTTPSRPRTPADKYDYFNDNQDGDLFKNYEEGSLTRNDPYAGPADDWQRGGSAYEAKRYEEKQNDPYTN